MSDEWFDTNRRMWDERVPIHVKGDFYDVDAFRQGACTLRAFEIEELGDVGERDLVHLQCHFGLDTLSWARRGARVTGLDFSEPAIAAARELARETALPARFEVANVYDATHVLGKTYDIVYTGLGALCWLPDLTRWAEVVRSLVRDGGSVYVSEFHPFSDVFSEDDLTLKFPYFNTEPTVWTEPGTYADLSAKTTNNRSYEWNHPVSEVIQALLHQRLVLECFREHDHTLFPRWPFLEERERKTYWLPEGTPSLPLMYSLKLRAT